MLRLRSALRDYFPAAPAAKIDFVDVASAAGVEIACDEVDKRLRERFSGISLVFLDPTPTCRR
ncbi:hypothetical protein ACIBQ1_01840 [Nonomuraea sp. NPDC050153]|uniref:hypothetical protein n=1 Tax=Nonomuraea sp. NPDC050153 TaxID=3364359 RepID=UPI0037B4609F